MLFSITLHYTRAAADIAPHLDAHRQWLVEYIKRGSIILAGPLEPRTGGLILASCADMASMQAMMEQDPFIVEQVASYAAQACRPALVASGFPAGWAPDANVV